MLQNPHNEDALHKIENLKTQLGKYNKIILNEGRPGGVELYDDQLITKYKTQLNDEIQKNHDDGIVESIIALRVNAMQISPELRKNMIHAFAKNDILHIVKDGNFEFTNHLLHSTNLIIVQNIASLISIIASSKEGIDYLVPNGIHGLVESIIKVTKVIF